MKAVAGLEMYTTSSWVSRGGASHPVTAAINKNANMYRHMAFLRRADRA
jgi:hypothetical protein